MGRSVKITCRIPIKLSIFDVQNGKMVFYTSSTVKSKIVSNLCVFLAQNRSLEWVGSCKIIYNKTDDYFNEFEFSTITCLNENISICTETNFLNDLLKDGTLDKTYTCKRQLTDRQKKLAKERLKKFKYS